MPMLASLSMYDFPGIRPQTEAFWTALAGAFAAQGINAPAALSQVDDLWALWESKALLFAQTCGFPYVDRLRGDVTLIGTPDYGIVSGKPGWYYSVVLCRQNDPRTHLKGFDGARFALNQTGSQSGCHAMMYTLLHEVGETRHFESCQLTGSHANSVQAVLAGGADIAAVDFITWLHLKRERPEMAGLRILMETAPTPGLPYITAKSRDGATLARCVRQAITSLPGATSDALFLRGFWESKDSDYDLIQNRATQSAGVFSAHFNQ